MGQRLNIEICNNEKSLANAYYHWSAYTSSAYDLLKKIIFCYPKPISENEVQNAVQLLTSTGAGLYDCAGEELEIIKDFPESLKKYAISRNHGLISMTKKAMEETRYWAEGKIIINIDTKTVSFDVFFDYEEEDYTEKERNKIIEKSYNIDFSNLKYEDIGIIEDLIIRSRLNDFKFVAIDKNGRKLMIIE